MVSLSERGAGEIENSSGFDCCISFSVRSDHYFCGGLPLLFKMITLEKAGEITSNKTATLNPRFKEKVEQWRLTCERFKILVYIYEGLRSLERQAELYAIGRSIPGRIVTKAQPGQSFHNYGLAIDWVPLIPNEKADKFYDVGWGEVEVYSKGQELAADHNLRCLSWERPHLEYAEYKDWRQAREALQSQVVI